VNREALVWVVTLSIWISVADALGLIH